MALDTVYRLFSNMLAITCAVKKMLALTICFKNRPDGPTGCVRLNLRLTRWPILKLFWLAKVFGAGRNSLCRYSKMFE